MVHFDRTDTASHTVSAADRYPDAAANLGTLVSQVARESSPHSVALMTALPGGPIARMIALALSVQRQARNTGAGDRDWPLATVRKPGEGPPPVNNPDFAVRIQRRDFELKGGSAQTRYQEQDKLVSVIYPVIDENDPIVATLGQMIRFTNYPVVNTGPPYVLPGTASKPPPWGTGSGT